MKNSVFIILSLVFLYSCSSASVKTDYDKGVDFRNYKTYGFFQNLRWGKTNELDQRRILKAVRKELDSKGFLESDESPDILVDVFNSDTDLDGGVLVGVVGIAIGIPSSSKATKYQKSLRVDLVDAKSDQLVWQGSYWDNLSNKDDVDEEITKAFARIFKKFPPKK